MSETLPSSPMSGVAPFFFFMKAKKVFLTIQSYMLIITFKFLNVSSNYYFAEQYLTITFAIRKLSGAVYLEEHNNPSYLNVLI